MKLDELQALKARGAVVTPDQHNDFQTETLLELVELQREVLVALGAIHAALIAPSPPPPPPQEPPHEGKKGK